MKTQRHKDTETRRHKKTGIKNWVTDPGVKHQGNAPRTRGWIAALEARTGKELWRWYVVPKPGDPGSETWKDKNNAWKTGGGGIWQTGSYDPAPRLTIWGTGNPVPQYDAQARPGDNLYTNSAVALNIDTGKLVWHFQNTPNDSWIPMRARASSKLYSRS